MVLIIDTLGLSTNEEREARWTGKTNPISGLAAEGRGARPSGQWPVAGEIEEAETTVIKKHRTKGIVSNWSSSES